MGDAVYCSSLLAGEGSASAMVGAYLLAGELQRAGSDYGRPFVERRQRSAKAFASSFAPLISYGLFVRGARIGVTTQAKFATRTPCLRGGQRHRVPKQASSPQI